MIIGITGRIASGKSIVTEYFIERGFTYMSLSQEVRDEAKQRGIKTTRKDLQDLGNELREKQGPGVLAKRIKEKIKDGDYIIDGIRNPGEVEELKKLEGFKLIGIEAPEKFRYERVVSRARASDSKSWEGFLEMDKRDFGEDSEFGQQVGKCIGIADFKINNDSDLNALYKKTEKIFEKIR